MDRAEGVAASGTFAIGGDLVVHRLGFGAMRITGPGVWGEPANRDEALGVLKRLPSLGITLIDTADSYGPGVSEALIREALHPYRGLVVATKGGLTRPGPGRWLPRADPAYLRSSVEGSLQRLGLEQVPLWQLHRIDPRVPRDEQFGAIAALRGEGLIRHVGLSQVKIEEIEAACGFFPVATVQNLYNLADRSSAEVLAYCEAASIGFIPWFPLAAGDLAKHGGPLAAIALQHRASPAQVALAWLIAKSPVMLPIPGTGSLSHLEENARAAGLRLTAADMAVLETSGRGR